MAFLTRVRGGPALRVGDGGGTVDIMIEVMSCYLFLPSSAPLVAFGVGHGRWSMWTQQQTTTALRKVVALAGARDWTRNPLVGGCCSVRADGCTVRTGRMFTVTEGTPVG